MNLRIAVVGAPGSGKTLFSINWCEYLGATRLYYYELNGVQKRKGIISPQAARDKMVVNGCRRAAHTFIVNRPGKLPSRLALLDTFRLQKKSSLSAAERTKLFMTLQILSEADVILNLVDLTCSDPAQTEFAAEIDRCLLEFSTRRRVHYKLVGNKLDLLGGRTEMCWWPVSGLPTHISAKKWTGFNLLTEQIISNLD